jgi:hypothetical protein
MPKVALVMIYATIVPGRRRRRSRIDISSSLAVKAVFMETDGHWAIIRLRTVTTEPLGSRCVFEPMWWKAILGVTVVVMVARHWRCDLLQS